MEEQITTTVAASLSILCMLLSLKPLYVMMPTFIASLHRTKVCLEMEFSRSMQMTRNRLCLGLVLPISTVVWHFRLYDPQFFGYLGPALRLAAIIVIVLLFWVMRTSIAKALRVRKIKIEIYEAGCNFDLTAFILTSLILMTEGLVLALCGAPMELARIILLCTCAATYFIFLLRKTQIFASDCPLYSAILYLCALEVLPTGILVATALFL